MYFNSVYFLKHLFPKRIWNIPTEEKILYLTFDDGPIPEVTPWVLQQLKNYHAKATFFCIGENMQKHPEILQQVKDKGHLIGNHTFNHLNGFKTKNETYLANVEKFESLGEPTNYFRPPYGRCSSKQAESIITKGYKIVMWDIISKDYDTRLNKEVCLNNVIGKAKEGSVIVFHDSLKAEKNLKYVLPKVLKHYSEKGFRFDQLP